MLKVWQIRLLFVSFMSLLTLVAFLALKEPIVTDEGEYPIICAMGLALLLGFGAPGLPITFSLFVLLFQEVEAKSAIVKDGKVVLDLQKKVYFWSWDRRLKQGFVSYGLGGKIVMHASSLTYIVMFEAFDTIEDYIFYRKSHEEKDVYEFIKYWLYEFNREKGEEFYRFDNPLEADQQILFFNTLKEFFRPYITGSGVRLSDATFGEEQKKY